jgi:zinc transport system permease protein
MDAALLVSIGVIVGVCAKALGSLPVFALSTLPAIAALAIARGRLLLSFLLSAGFGTAAGASGYVLAFFADFDVGASQTVVAVAIAAVAIAVGRLLALASRRAPSVRSE